MEYMCIITKKDRKCQNASKCLLRNGTASNDTSSYILLDHSNAFNLSGGNFLSRTSLPEPILSGEGGGGEFFNYSPFWGPLAFWLDQTGTCTTWLWGLQYKTIIGSLCRARATRRLGRHSRLQEADFALRIIGGEVKVALLYQKSLC